MILEAQPDIEVVGEAANGRDAVALARRQAPDVVLMDVRMPELDGIEATRRVMSAAQPTPRVLMLTTFDLDEYVYRAIRAGAERLPAQGRPWYSPMNPGWCGRAATHLHAAASRQSQALGPDQLEPQMRACHQGNSRCAAPIC